MRKDDKTCDICGRHYRGDGFPFQRKENFFRACTSACYAEIEYARKFKKGFQRLRKNKKIVNNVNLHEKKPEKENKIEAENQKWLNTPYKEKVSKGPNPMSEILNRSHVAKTQWVGRQYKAVRG